MGSDHLKIGTWPTPEQPITIEIPSRFLQEFEKEVRVIIRYPVIGIPVPDTFFKRFLKNPEAYQELAEKFEIMLIPKQRKV